MVHFAMDDRKNLQGPRDGQSSICVVIITVRVVYSIVMEANCGIILCHHDTYPSRHYAGCCLYPNGFEFY